MATKPVWQPKYPDFADNTRNEGELSSNPEGVLPGEFWTRKTEGGETERIQWIDSPATSNTHSFAYESSREGSPYYSRLAALRGRSVLHVRFKPSEGRDNTVRHYGYYFDDDASGERVFEQMKASGHPWGDVGYPTLVGGEVPYERYS